MRKYPTLTEQATSRDFIDNFGGYNHNLRIGENEFYDMKNLTADNYPTLSTRKKRGLEDIVFFTEESKLLGIISKDSLYCIYMDTSSAPTSTIYAYVNKYRYTIGETTIPADTPRQIVSMGAYIVIFPDKLYFDTTDMTNKKDDDILGKSLETKCTFTGMSLAFCDDAGRKITPVEFFDSSRNNAESFLSNKVDSDEAKEVLGPLNDKYYCDSYTGTFYFWNEQNKIWLTSETYIMIIGEDTNFDFVNFDEFFNVGDSVRLSGFADVDHEQSQDAQALDEVFNNNLDQPFIIKAFAENDRGKAIVLSCNPAKPTKAGYLLYSEITIEKRTPDMDFVIESNNRLWGCRYGLNRDGEVVNEIYACALGDFTNWECFSGTSQDSYVASLGSDGVFTGAISYLGNPIFFKQNCIHTIFGTYPATYQIQNTECRGVQEGCDKSLVIIDGAVFYKAVGGVCAYTGSLPTEIASQFNEQGIQYRDAVAGAFRKKYHLAMKDGTSDKRILFVYDTTKGLWHKEDYIDVDFFATVSNTNADSLFFGTTDSPAIWQTVGDGSLLHEEEGNIDWFVETGVIGCSMPDKKYISRMSVRLSVDIGTRVYVFAEYDSSGTWEQIGVMTGVSLKTFSFPVKPKRCDHFRLKITGTGGCKIYSISKTLEQGSDI